MGHVTWPRPCQGRFVICRLGHAMFNLHTKFKVSKTWKAMPKCNKYLSCCSQTSATAKLYNSHVTITTPLLWVICHAVARLDIAYLCTKFDDFKFSRSSRILDAGSIRRRVSNRRRRSRSIVRINAGSQLNVGSPPNAGASRSSLERVW